MSHQQSETEKIVQKAIQEKMTYLEPMLIDNLTRLKKKDGKFRIKVIFIIPGIA